MNTLRVAALQAQATLDRIDGEHNRERLAAVRDLLTQGLAELG